MNIDRNEARRLYAATSQGRWEPDTCLDGVYAGKRCLVKTTVENDVVRRREVVGVRQLGRPQVKGPEIEANAEFIAHAHNHWLEMLDYIEKLEARLQQSPFGDDKIDELEEATNNLRFQLEQRDRECADKERYTVELYNRARGAEGSLRVAEKQLKEAKQLLSMVARHLSSSGRGYSHAFEVRMLIGTEEVQLLRRIIGEVTESKYDIATLAAGSRQLIAEGRQSELNALLYQFGVCQLTSLPPEKFKEYAEGLRALGVEV